MKDYTTATYIWMTAFFLLFTTSLMGQGWEYAYFDDPNTPSSSRGDNIFIQEDGSFLILGFIGLRPQILALDENGILSSQIVTSGESGYTRNVRQTEDGNFVDTYRILPPPGSNDPHGIRSFDHQGNVLWEYNLPVTPEEMDYTTDLFLTADGQYLVVNSYYSPLSIDPYVTKIDANGNITWIMTGTNLPINTGYYYFQAVQLTDGSYFMAGSPSTSPQGVFPNPHFIHFSDNGEILEEGLLDVQVQIQDILLSPAGEVVIAGESSLSTAIMAYKLGTTGLETPELLYQEEVSIATFATTRLMNTANGGYAIAYTTSITQNDSKFRLINLDIDGNLIWAKNYGSDGNEELFDAKALPDGGFVLSGILGTPQDNVMYIVRTDNNGDTFTSQIHGQVYHDINEDCETQDSEQTISNWIVSAENINGFIGYSSVNSDGHYTIRSNEGEHIVRLHPANDYWSACEDEFTITVTEDTSIVDFAAQNLNQCPLLNVQIWSPSSLRLCEEQTYTVYCTNQGTLLAEAAYVNLTLPDNLSFVDASIPFTDLGNQQYAFDLGDIDFLQDTSFTFTTMVGCELELMGQSLCVTAQIFPDTICLPNDPNWSGASIEATARCQDGEAILSLTNVGTASMSQILNYVVIEDHVIMMQDVPYGPLAPGESIEVPQPANGSFYRIESEQESAHPLSNNPIAFLEGCGTNDMGETSLGFVNQYPLGDDAPFFDVNCEEVVAAYDPNDKAAFPGGYTEEHFLEPNTRIDYRIRFQNTGTSYANKVVIIDELDPNLDPATIHKGVSSHEYEFELLADGVLRFTFNDIMLPDSTSDLAGSQGFVHFSIDQKADLPIGTLIENAAAIFFDFNPSIITNTTWHTIGRPFVNINTEEVAVPGLEVRVFPNPYSESATVILKMPSSTQTIQATRFDLFDIHGQQVQSLSINGAQFTLNRNGLAAGMYFYRISAKNKMVASGRVVVLQ